MSADFASSRAADAASPVGAGSSTTGTCACAGMATGLSSASTFGDDLASLFSGVGVGACGDFRDPKGVVGADERDTVLGWTGCSPGCSAAGEVSAVLAGGAGW